MLHLRATCLADTHAIAAGIAGLARTGDTIVLAGEMGAGKTAFAQGFGRALGVQGPITSPTFTLVHSYDAAQGAKQLHHADLYRLERTTEVADLAFGELAETGIVLVEWGDIVENSFGDHLTVYLDPDDVSSDSDDDADVLSLDGARTIGIVGVGAAWAARWERLTQALADFRC